MTTSPTAQRQWTFFTNHGHVLVFVSRNPDARVRDIAAEIGITERATQAILSDLSQAGYVTATRVGRRNTYRIHPDQAFRHPVESEHTVGEILSVFLAEDR
ncbi:MAG: helix-turn-helix domain-containing protein [Candidatus Nanopelagicales bacterium]